MPIQLDDILFNKAAITGFRNIAVHQYEELDLDILKHIAETGYRDFITFCSSLGLKILE